MQRHHSHDRPYLHAGLLPGQYGSDKEHILFAQVFLKDVIRDFDDMNEVWESWVTPGCEPARATVQAKMAKEEALVEIVVTAVRKDA